jgi:hypothetical protein
MVFYRLPDEETPQGQPRLRREDQVKSDVEDKLVAIIASFWPIDRERRRAICLKVRAL